MCPREHCTTPTIRFLVPARNDNIEIMQHYKSRHKNKRTQECRWCSFVCAYINKLTSAHPPAHHAKNLQCKHRILLKNRRGSNTNLLCPSPTKESRRQSISDAIIEWNKVCQARLNVRLIFNALFCSYVLVSKIRIHSQKSTVPPTRHPWPRPGISS